MNETHSSVPDICISAMLWKAGLHYCIVRYVLILKDTIFNFESAGHQQGPKSRTEGFSAMQKLSLTVLEHCISLHLMKDRMELDKIQRQKRS